MGRLRQYLLTSLTVLAAASPNAHGQAMTVKPAPDSLRQAAFSALESAAADAGDVEDIGARAALAERVVRLLAKSKPERCRQMLDALFDAALGLKRQGSSAQAGGGVNADEAINRTVGIAAGFDEKLAALYVRKYAEVLGQANGPTAGQPDPSRGTVSGSYLSLASELIERDPALAVSAAGRSLPYGVTTDTLLFLAKLRKKSKASADNFFAAALRSVASRGGDDVNELFRLYSYVFATKSVPLVTSGALVSEQLPGYARLTEGESPDRDLSVVFLRTSARILLDPARDGRRAAEQQTSGAPGDYYFLKAVAPLAAAFTPSLSASLAARQAALSNFLAPAQRDAALSPSGQRAASANDAAGGANDTDSLLEQAGAADDARLKDNLYFKAAMSALRDKKYEVAFEAVGRVSADRRDGLRQYVRHAAARQCARDGRLQEAEELAAADDDIGRRAYVLTLVAESSVRNGGDFGRANALLSEVERLSAKLAGRERAVVLAGAAFVYANYDTVRASQLIREVIEAGNKLDGFTADAKMTRSLVFDGFSYFYDLYGGGLTLGGALKQQARRTFDATLTDVRQIKSPVFRLGALVSLCEGALGG